MNSNTQRCQVVIQSTTKVCQGLANMMLVHSVMLKANSIYGYIKITETNTRKSGVTKWKTINQPKTKPLNK